MPNLLIHCIKLERGPHSTRLVMRHFLTLDPIKNVSLTEDLDFNPLEYTKTELFPFVFKIAAVKGEGRLSRLYLNMRLNIVGSSV